MNFDRLASIYLKDGTSVPVAQVQGTPEYQAFMRKPLHAAWRNKSTFLCQYLNPALDHLIPLFGSTISVCRSPKIESTLSVMHSLKTAVEAYLGTNICYAKLTMEISGQAKKEIAQETLQALGLRELPPATQTVRMVLYEYNSDMRAPPGYEEPLIILAIDHSKHWYYIGLFEIGESGIVDPIEGFSPTGPTIDKEQQLEALGQSLRRMIANPPDGIHDLPKQIHQIMIYGDDTKNESLHGLLESILSTDLVQSARVSDNIFDGTNYAARMAYAHMDTINYEKPPWGCRLRSSLYNKPRNDNIQTEL